MPDLKVTADLPDYSLPRAVADEKGSLQKIRTVSLGQDLKPIAGSEGELECDLLLIAAGFLGAQGEVPKAFGVELNDRTM